MTLDSSSDEEISEDEEIEQEEQVYSDSFEQVEWRENTNNPVICNINLPAE